MEAFNKIRIYRDTRGNVNPLKNFNDEIDIYQFPYDSGSRFKYQKLANPSDAQWGDLNVSWEEVDFSFDDFILSPIFSQISKTMRNLDNNDRGDILQLAMMIGSWLNMFIDKLFKIKI